MNCIFKIIYCILLIIFIIPKSLFASNTKGPIVIITVDVETTQYGNHSLLSLPEQVNAVCMNEVPCGLQTMVNLLKKYGYSATFFFNPYEYKKHGEQSIMEIAQWLNESGNDVQLHTHPQWAYDEKRNLMHQYTLKEQIEIIREGKELLQKWTGQPVVAHRAGAYGADENTVRALIRNNIYYDSSLFIRSANSKIRLLNFKKNTLSMYGHLYEFPVTVYKRHEYPFLLSDQVKPYSVISKYDVNFFGSEAEADKAFQEALDLKMDFIILFLHSFSFIKEYDDAGNMEAKIDSLRIFEHILKFISERKLTVMTFRGINNNIVLDKYLNRHDSIPEISIQISTIQYLRKIAGINRWNYKIYALAAGLSILLIIIGIAVLKRKRN